MEASTSVGTKNRSMNLSTTVSNIWNELYIKTTSIQSLTKELNSLKNQVEVRRKRNEEQRNLLKEKESVHYKLSQECIELRTTIVMLEDEKQQYLKSIQVIDEKIKHEEGHLHEKMDELLNLRAEYTDAVLDSLTNVKVHEANEVPQDENISLPQRWNSPTELAQTTVSSRETLNRLKAKRDDLIQRCEENTHFYEHLVAKVKRLDADIVNEKVKYERIEKIKGEMIHSPFKLKGGEANPLVYSQVSTPMKFTQESGSQNRSSILQQCKDSETPLRNVSTERSNQGPTASIKTDGYAPPLKNRMRSFPADEVANNETEVVPNKKKFIPKKAMFSGLKKHL